MLIFWGLGLICWPWAIAVLLLFPLYYHRIVHWEEQVLLARIGEPYQRYLERVPRWWPKGQLQPGVWELRRALRSERSTLLALGVILGLFYLRSLY